MYIEDYEKTPTKIIVYFTPEAEIEVDLDDFEKFLKNHGYLYHESTEVVDGQYKTSFYNLDINDYFEHSHFVHVVEDLTDYLKEKQYFLIRQN